MALAVYEPSEEIGELRKQWALLEDLNGGTPAMRKAGVRHLPQWPAEDPLAYGARLATATLFPAYRRTVGVMSGKPFAKPLDLVDAPASIETWAEDIDLQGVSLHSFAAEMFEETFYGLAGILVSYPKAGAAFRSKAEQEASGQRPYFVRVTHHQILGHRSTIVGGKLRLTQLRLMESTEEEDGPFGVKCVQQVRVLFPGGWNIWQEIDKGKWVLTEEGTTTLTEIPFVPMYGKRKGFMCGHAPLLDLAYLNVKHWQSQSDQDTILHVARVPILAIFGADEKTQFTVGGASAVTFSNPDADMKFVEHTGAAIKAGDEALSALEQQMIQTGAELLVKQPGSKRTATESQTDAEANKSDLQRMAENFEDAMDQALYFMAQFASLPDGGKVKLYADYGTGTLSEASAALIADLQVAGLISKATTITELQRRGVLSDDIDPETEIAAVEAEGPPPGTLTAPTMPSDLTTNANVGA